MTKHQVGDLVYDPIDGLGIIQGIKDGAGYNYPYRIFYFKNEYQSLASSRTINDLKVILQQELRKYA